jgi:hypothetical protein
MLVDRMKELKKKIGSDRFLNNSGLGNEVPFYIFDYDPKKELNIREFVKNDLLKSYEGHDKVNIVEIDLFELLVESMKNDKIFDKAFKREEKSGSEKLFESLKKSFNSEIILKFIKEKSGDKNVVLITGIGKVYPIIRSHNVLNNLQTIFDHEKVILFFPGEYTKQDLILFKKFTDNNYYRAFQI